MADLYLLFFIVGIILFTAVVAYSLYQQNKRTALDDDEFDSSPLNVRSVAADPEPEPRIEPSLSAANNADSAAKSPDSAADVVVTSAESVGSVSGAVSEQPSASALDKAKSAVARIKPRIKPKNSPSTGIPSVETKTQRTPITQDAPGDAGKLEPSLAEEAATEDKMGVIAPSTEPKTTTVFSDDDSVVTDLVARVLNPRPIEQSDLLSLFREHDYKFSRKVHIYGLNELTDMWRDIEFELPSARFLELGISIQLCDREGAMSAKESHDFQQMVLQFCEKFDAPFEFSIELDAALKQAQALDQVGRRYDSMAVLNVVPKSKSGFRIADIQSCARDLMMSTDKNGIFMKTEGQKNNITVLYRLACTDGDGHFGIRSVSQTAATPVYDLVVYMNVPATRDPEMVFQQMVKDANDLATWLDGKVVDRAGKAMTQRTYSTLMQQISDIAYSMQQDGLVPGDAVAKKLF